MNTKLILLFILSIWIKLGVSDKNCYDSQSGISLLDRHNIVEIHNEIRKKFSKGNLLPDIKFEIPLKNLSWNEELAEEAQEMARQNEFKHKKVIVSREKWCRKIGQNLYVVLSTFRKPKRNWPKCLEAWYTEYKNYSINNKNPKNTGHFSQMISTEVEYIGCGYYNALNKNEQLEWPFKFQQLYVCNYGILKRRSRLSSGTKNMTHFSNFIFVLLATIFLLLR